MIQYRTETGRAGKGMYSGHTLNAHDSSMHCLHYAQTSSYAAFIMRGRDRLPSGSLMQNQPILNY